MIWLYRALWLVLLPVVAVYLGLRLRRGKEHKTRLKERFGFSNQPRPTGQLVWVHCASVGEAISILPLAEKLSAAKVQLLVTSGTTTSAKVLAARLPKQAIHQFVPIDFAPCVWLFMRHWRPDVSVFVESEFWPELLWQAPAPMVVSARISDASFAKYQRWNVLVKPLLQRLNPALTQTEEDANRLRELGAPVAKRGGNLKFDVVVAPPKNMSAWKKWQNKPVLVVASTHPGEEEHVVALHQILKKKQKDLVTILVPRHPERGPQVAQLAEKAGVMPELRSIQPEPVGDFYVADTIGELPVWYALARVVVMGGSFVPHGGQNPLEPVKMGVPTLCGPHMFNFSEMMTQLQALNLITQVPNARTLTDVVAPLLATAQRVDPKALQKLSGATDLAAQHILEKLKG